MKDISEIADSLEAEAFRKVRGWYGAEPCKPDDEIVKAAHFLAVAQALRARSG